MIRRIRLRLFVASSALLVLIAIVATVRLGRHAPDVDLSELVAIAIAIALGSAAVLSWLVGQILRWDLRELVTAARRNPGAGLAEDGEPDDVDDWVHDIAADAAKHLSAVARQRALLAGVLDSVSNGVIALDAEERIVVINEGARRLLALTTTPIGELLIDVVRAPALLELVRAPRDATAELELRPGLRVLARVTPPAERGPRVLIVEDVTAMRRLETMRRDFVANVSHELRTPVAVIRANAETLLGNAAADPEMSAQLLDGLHRNAERLARMLADLLDLSRLDAGQFRFELGDVGVSAAADAVRAAVEPVAAQRGVSVHVDTAPDVVARADPKALDQVLVNLVDNAVKYGNKGGNVWIRGRRVDDRIRLEVCDDGPGIAPLHRERIFERFYRADSGRTRDAGGTGLGLAIVKHLVESMGGEVGVDANGDQGTRFWIDLPSANA